MNIEKEIERSAELRRKRDYYLSLGYSRQAAEILSVFTYGDEKMAFLVKTLDRRNVIDGLSQWLRSREEPTAREAVRAFYNRAMKELEGGDADPFGSVFIGSAPQPAVETSMAWADMDKEEVDELDRIFAGGEGAPFEELLDADEAYADAPAAPQIIDKSCRMPNAMMCLNLGAGFSRRSPGGRKLAEALSTDAYAPIEEKGTQSVLTAPTSTFRMTTSNASMGVVFNQLRRGRRVKLDQVRIEELMNAFDYEVPLPESGAFRVTTELLEKKGNKRLLFIDAQAAEQQREHQNVILLLDTSGSMSGNAEVTQQLLATALSKLSPGDRVSLITYSTEDHTVFEAVEIRDEGTKEALMGVILGIEIEGCTYGSAGIETAYAIGQRQYRPDWNNQVILITDGDLNFGITDKRGLQELIEEKKKSGLFLSVIGTGLYNYQDEKLEVLSKHGNGTYCVVNALADVDEWVNRRWAALTNIVAKDVKAQVEFNPRFVKNYRLLGYENRQLKHEDFRNDAVISEPYGSGGHGVALYELELAEGDEAEAPRELKYQRPVLTDSPELGTVSIRFKEPLGEESRLIEQAVLPDCGGTRNAQLAYLLYCLAEELRGSDRLDEYDRQYLDVMLTSGLYRNFSGHNREKLELLIRAFRSKGQKPDNPWGELPF